MFNTPKNPMVRARPVLRCGAIAIALVACAGLALAMEIPKPAAAKTAQTKTKKGAKKRPARRAAKADKVEPKADEAVAPLTRPAADAVGPAAADAPPAREQAADQPAAAADEPHGPAHEAAEETGAVQAAPAVQAQALNLLNLEQQFLAQFRSVLTAEINFVNKVCQLTDDQRQLLEKSGEKRLKQSVKKYAAIQQKMMQGGGVDAKDAQLMNEMSNPQAIAQKALESAVKAILAPEQATRLRDELSRRKEYRKQAAIQALVARVDDDLVLSAEQRDKLAQSLAEKWQEVWGQSAESFLYSDQFYPPVPNEMVEPILDESQRKALQEAHQGMAGGVFFGGGIAIAAPAVAVDIAVEEGDAEEGNAEAAKDETAQDQGGKTEEPAAGSKGGATEKPRAESNADPIAAPESPRAP